MLCRFVKYTNNIVVRHTNNLFSYKMLSSVKTVTTQPTTSIKPLRIVTLLPSATEIVALLQSECTDKHRIQLVGRSHECDYPTTPDIQNATVLTAARITSTDSIEIDTQVKSQLHRSDSLYTLDGQLLQQLQPDIIITQSLCTVCSIDYNAVKQIRDAMPNSTNIKIVCLNPVSINDVMNDIVHIGNEIGVSSEAKAVVARLHRRFDRALLIASHNIQQYKQNHIAQIRCAFFEWLAPIYGGGHWTSEMIELTGAVHTLSRINMSSIEMTTQYVIDSKPSHLILAPCGFGLEKTKSEAEIHLFNKQWFTDLQAVQNNNMCVVDGNQYFNRSGPRLIDCFEFLVAYFYQRYDIISPDFAWQSVQLIDGKPVYTTHTNNIPESIEPVMSVDKTQQSDSTTNAIDTWQYNPVPLPAIKLPTLAPEIEEVHKQACNNNQDTYIDPDTGYTVFTEYAHRKRGQCCGSMCRHCPYNYINVKSAKLKNKLKQNEIKQTTYFKYDTDTTQHEHVDILSYSGGKDSYMTLLHLVHENQQSTTKRKIILLTTFLIDTQIIPLQGLHITTVLEQAKHIKHDIITVALPSKYSNNAYIQCIKTALTEHIPSYSTIRLVYGDLHLNDMIQWRTATMSNILPNATLYFPLFYRPYTQLLQLLNYFALCDKLFQCIDNVKIDAVQTTEHKQIDFTTVDEDTLYRYGYKQITISSTSVNNKYTDILQTGTVYNGDLLTQLPNNIDLFGENGEFHTNVQFT